MNERIRELAHEAGLPTYNPEGVPTKLEKFAELIVQECIECADVVGKANYVSSYPNSTAYHIKQKIKEHFGVEE